MTLINDFPHHRNFGIELEFYNLTHEKVASLLRRAGIQCWSDNEYCEETDCTGDCWICSGQNRASTGWKITDDGSINGNDTVELVSPILSGPAGLEEVAKVVKLMAAAGGKVNKTCGFHVHVNAQDLSSGTLVNVYRRYAKHEAQIDSFMVPSRRGNLNGYCKSPTSMLYMLDAATPAMSCEDVAELMFERWVGGTYIGGRYNKVNLCAYLRHGTIEFRHHSGTLNVNKVINWIAFCVNFVETSIRTDSDDIFTGVHPDSVVFFNQRIAELA
jgi:hypothetical protein